MWQQGTFDEFYKSLPLHRRTADEEKLAVIFSHAATMPLFRDALNWAFANKVKIFIDHTTTAGGYYSPGTGVVALAVRHTDNIADAVGVLAHEIRHAWQDQRDMIPTLGRSFAEYFIKIALIEADAMAFEKTARAEAVASLSDSPSGITQANRSEEMWRNFQGFYHGKDRRAENYGATKASFCGFKFSLPGAYMKKFFFEYKSSPIVIKQGISVETVDDVFALGRMFDNENYLSKSAARDLFVKEYLSPGHAMTYFNGLAAKPDKLASRVRREYLRINAQRRIKRYL